MHAAKVRPFLFSPPRGFLSGFPGIALFLESSSGIFFICVENRPTAKVANMREV
jgi:hypothetical protein